MKIFSIEGNIGSGKSTLIENLKKYETSFIYLPEPVDLWNEIKDSSGVTILEKYYQDQMSWKQGIISAIIISFIIVFFSPVTQFIIHEFISPNFLENTINYTVISKKLTLAEAKEYTTLTSSIWKNISDGLSFGVVIGAIVAYLIQSKTIDTSKSN